MLIEALSTRLGRTAASMRSELYWRFARPGTFRHRFEQAVTNMSHGICLYDAQDRLQLVNEQFCRIYSQPMDTLHDKQTLEKLWESGKAPWKKW